MPSFVFDAGTIPEGKEDAGDLQVPSGQGLTATEWNTTAQAIKDCREAILAAPYRTPVARLLAYDNVGAQDNTGWAAAVAGNAAADDYEGGGVPTHPRSARVVFGAAWSGGDVTIHGTDQFGNDQTETIADVAGTTVQGVKIWSDIHYWNKQSVGGTADTASIGFGQKIGVGFELDNTTSIFWADGTIEAVTLEATNHSFIPTTAPNGTHDYKLLANVKVPAVLDPP